MSHALEYPRGSSARPTLAPIPRAWPGLSSRQLALSAVLTLILLIAAVVRIRDLPAAYGTLGVDEARLALVAEGLAEHGWPVLPTGKVYTRGLVPALLAAPFLKLLGPTDFAARLPSVLAGLLLVPVMFLYGRRLGGVGAGLLAAALAALYPPLVEWSRQAWFYSTLSLFWLLALYLCDRAVTQNDRRAWLLSLIAAALAVLTHELAVLLVPLVGLRLLAWAWTGPDRLGRLRFAVLACTPLALALGLLAAFTLTLRSDTPAGSLGEIRGFIASDFNLDGLGFYFADLAGARGWLILPGLVAAIALADGPLRRRLLLPLASIAALLVAITIVIQVQSPQYALALTPPLLLVGAIGVTILARRLAARLPSRFAIPAAAGLYVLILAAWFDPAGLAKSTEVGWQNNPWIENLYALGYQPGDLVITDLPTVTQFYLGRVDFWARSVHHEKYTTLGPDGQRRDIHSGALLVRTRSDFAELVRDPNEGKVAWVIASNEVPHWYRFLDSDLRKYLTQQADARKMPKSGPQIFMHQL